MTLLDLPTAAVPPFLDVDGLPCATGHPDAWFPNRRDITDEGAANLCAGCPALAECRDYALDERIEFGIWGGLTETARSRARARRSDHTNQAGPDPFPLAA